MAFKFYERGKNMLKNDSRVVAIPKTRKLYIVFMDSCGNYGSAYADIDEDITMETVEEMEKRAAKSVGLRPKQIIILNWKVLEG